MDAFEVQLPIFSSTPRAAAQDEVIPGNDKQCAFHGASLHRGARLPEKMLPTLLAT